MREDGVTGWHAAAAAVARTTMGSHELPEVGPPGPLAIIGQLALPSRRDHLRVLQGHRHGLRPCDGATVRWATVRAPLPRGGENQD
jgi:hypothetical protein